MKINIALAHLLLGGNPAAKTPSNPLTQLVQMAAMTRLSTKPGKPPRIEVTLKCPYCGTMFTTKEPRRLACGNVCGQRLAYAKAHNTGVWKKAKQQSERNRKCQSKARTAG